MNFIKKNYTIKKLYVIVFSFFISCFSKFFKKESIIIFNSYGGKKFDDSPKIIFEKIKEDRRFKDYRLIWAFHKPENYDIAGAEIVRTDTLAYFIYLFKAKIWITNSSLERGLNIKSKDTFYVNTWHGTPIKKMGYDLPEKFTYGFKYDYDLFLVQSEYEKKIFSRSFRLPDRVFFESGLPRNEKLNKEKENKKLYNEILHRLNIPLDKKIILYAPTYRDSKVNLEGKDSISSFLKSNFCKNPKESEYIILLRAHYEVNMREAKLYCGNVIDVTKYSNLNDLLLISDYLVSDYSSIIFDYSVMERPIFIYSFEKESYIEERGVYIDIEAEFPLSSSSNVNDLYKIINDIDEIELVNQTIEFKNKYINYIDYATDKVVDRIAEVIDIENINH